MNDMIDYNCETNRSIAGLPNIWTPYPGEITHIVRQQEIAQQQEIARQQEQMYNGHRNMSQSPTYFMMTPNGTIHYYYY